MIDTTEQKEELKSYCGTYCGKCKKFLTNECPGCKKNDKANWCKIRICCISNNYSSCADCYK